jgi:GT2 family glycosyltransferase
MLDADTVLVRPLSEEDVDAALGGAGLGLVEQETIVGSETTRSEFLDHYCRHTLAFLEPGAAPPALDAFRYYNSGVVLGRRAELEGLSTWALASIDAAERPYLVGEHMIADQDYVQYWANGPAQGRTVALSWDWNHCEHWHEPFPRAGARVLHFSNFCNGLTSDAAARMRAARTANFDIVVVTHQSATALDRCLTELGEAAAHVLVVDNGSTDGTAAVAEQHGVRVHLIGRNLGYGAAATEGARLSDAEALVFLNPDCLASPTAIAAGLTALAHDGDGCVVPQLDEGGLARPGRQPGYTRLKLLADILHQQLGESRPVGLVRRLPGYDDVSWWWPHGACLFVRRDRFLELGGFLPDLFMYMEDVEFGRRLYRAGGQVTEAPVRVVHAGGTGSEIDRGERSRLLDEGRLAYARLTYGPAFERFLRLARRGARVWAGARR